MEPRKRSQAAVFAAGHRLQVCTLSLQWHTQRLDELIVGDFAQAARALRLRSVANSICKRLSHAGSDITQGAQLSVLDAAMLAPINRIGAVILAAPKEGERLGKDARRRIAGAIEHALRALQCEVYAFMAQGDLVNEARGADVARPEWMLPYTEIDPDRVSLVKAGRDSVVWFATEGSEAVPLEFPRPNATEPVRVGAITIRGSVIGFNDDSQDIKIVGSCVDGLDKVPFVSQTRRFTCTVAHNETLYSRLRELPRRTTIDLRASVHQWIVHAGQRQVSFRVEKLV